MNIMEMLSWADLIFPIVTGLVLLGGQFVIQPRIAAREHFNRAKWDAKRDMYKRTISVVNEKFSSIDQWVGKDVPPDAATITPSEPPSAVDVNQCYAELAIYSNRDVLRAFIQCFTDPNAATRTQLLGLMRQDLGLGSTDIDEDDTWFVLEP
jgi:hypothetical protein